MTDKELAGEHWGWLEPLLKLYGASDGELARSKYLFISAWIHGVKHEKGV